MNNKFKLIIALTLFFSISVSASPIRLGLDANTFARNDDGSVLVDTGINFNFFGIDGPNVFLNNNGNVTFNNALGTFTPFGISAGATPIIAPFFADVDTRGPGDAVTYGAGIVDGRSAFAFNWINVGHFSQSSPLNSFQLVFIDRSDISSGDFDFEFNYGSILFETGDASGGVNGLGGTSASAGFSNGAGTFFELDGSLENGAFLDSGPSDTSLINNRLNSDIDGRFVFNVRNGLVQDDEPDDSIDVPEPSAIALMGLALISLSVRRKYNRK